MEQLQTITSNSKNCITYATAQPYTALYARLSQDDGNEGDSNSIINQKKILEDYAKKHNYIPYKIFIDDGISGTTFDRPDFVKMIKEAEQGNINRVIVKDLSRFGRDYIKVGLYTEFLFPEKDIHFIAINDDVDSNKHQENDLTPFKNLFNEWYAKDCSKKIKSVKKAKGMAGEHTTTNAPYGYVKNPSNPKEWLVDDEASNIVKEIFHLCVQGKGVTEIANELTERKILCPTAYARSKGYPIVTTPPLNPYQWNGATIKSILERMEYLGHTVNFKTFRKSYKQKKKFSSDKSEWMIFENTQEAIIDQETFDIVQKIRQGRVKQTRTGIKSIFSGMLFCADCGAKLSYRHVPSDMDKDNFSCSNYRHNTRACSMHYIRNKVLEELVKKNLQEMVSYVQAYENDFVNMLTNLSIKEQTKDKTKKKYRLLDIQKRIEELDNLFQHIYEDNVCGKLTDSRFQKLSKGYEEEQEQLIEEMKNLEIEMKNAEQQTINVKSFLAIVQRYTRITELTPEILHEFIDRIIIHEGDKSSGKRTQEIEIIYNYIGKIEQFAIKSV